MTGKTHILGGMDAVLIAPLLSTTLATSLVGMNHAELAMCLGAAVVGSLFPDIDLHGSKMGHKAGAASWVIQFVFGHRTLFHSPLLMLIIYLGMAIFFPEYQTYTVFFLIGMGSHLLLDMCNKKGIPLLYPFPKRFHIASVRTRSAAEAVFAAVLLLVFVAFAVYFLVLS